MVQITNNTKIVAAEDTLSTTLDDESVILHVDSGKYFGFNEVGTKIWELLAEPHSIAELTQQIASEYEITEERCRTDIEELVEELVQKELVDICDQ